MNSFQRIPTALILFFAIMCDVRSWADDVSKPEGPFRVLGQYKGVTQLAVSHDGGLAAWVSNNQLTLSDTVEGPIRITFPYVMSFVNSLDFSPDGKLLAVGNAKSTKLIDTQTGKEILNIERAKYFQMYSVKFSPNGKKIAVGGGTLYHNYLGIFDVETGKLISEPIQDYGSFPAQLVFSPSGRYLAVNFGISASVIDSESGKVIDQIKKDAQLIWFTGTVNGAPEKDSYILGMLSKGVLTFMPIEEARDGVQSAIKVIPEWNDAKRPLSHVWARGLIAVAEGQNVSLFNATGKEEVLMNGRGRGGVARVAFSADGRVAAIGRDNGTVDLWKL